LGVRWSTVIIKQGVSCVVFFESGSCPVAPTRTCAGLPDLCSMGVRVGLRGGWARDD